MSEFAFVSRYCTINMGAKVSIDSDLKYWLPANIPQPDIHTRFKIEQVWSNGSVMVSAPGYGERSDYGNGGVTVWNISDITIEATHNLTVEEVRSIVYNTEFYPKFYLPSAQHESLLISLTEKINSALNPHVDVMIPFIKSRPVRRVVSAANHYTHPLLPTGSLLIAGARHGDDVMSGVLDAVEHAYDIVLLEWKEGFIDQWGDYMDRLEAYQVVQDSGQPFDATRNVSTYELFSEGIY